jgi:hypothetical protein
MIQKHHTIAHDVEYPTANTASPGRVRPEVELGKVKDDGVLTTQVDRKGISEMSIAFTCEELGVGSTGNRARRERQPSVEVIVVRPPVPSQMIGR